MIGSNNSRLFFFGADKNNGRYAFKKDIDDKRVFYLNPEEKDTVMIYETFLDLLYDKMEAVLRQHIIGNKL